MNSSLTLFPVPEGEFFFTGGNSLFEGRKSLLFPFFLVPLLFAFVSSRGRNYFFFPFFIKHSFITPFSSFGSP
jgi:hypothetical protein